MTDSQQLEVYDFQNNRLVSEHFWLYGIKTDPNFNGDFDYYSFRANTHFLNRWLIDTVRDSDEYKKRTKVFFHSYFFFVLKYMIENLKFTADTKVSFAIFNGNGVRILFNSYPNLTFSTFMVDYELFWNIIKPLHKHGNVYDFNVAIE